MSALKELRDYLGGFAARCKAAQWLGALFHVGVCIEIVADVAKTQEQAAQEAYSAQQADIEAARELEEALKDGIDASDLPRIQRALAHVRNSAKADQSIGEILGA